MRGNLRGVQGPSWRQQTSSIGMVLRQKLQPLNFPGERCREPPKPAWSRRSRFFMSVLQKVGKEEFQGSSGSAQARPQGMEEQVAVKHLNLILCDLMKGSPAQCSRQAWATVAPCTSNLRRFKYCNDLPENHHATAISPLPTLCNTNPLDSS